MNSILVSIDELWLKGNNRPSYFRAVTSHIRQIISTYLSEEYTCKNENQRILVRAKEKFSPECLKGLSKIPGIHTITPVCRIKPIYKDLFPVVEREMEKVATPQKTFRVITKRIDKKFPKKSMDVCKEVGEFVLNKFPFLKVDLKRPQIKLQIIIGFDAIYLSTSKIAGTGGLPWGTGGHVITLLSGGFDSPVASYLMAKRGCRQTFIFFHSYPFVGDEVKEKILDLFRILSHYQRYTRLYVIPFGELQESIAQTCRPEYRTMMFRRYMVECANLLADKISADALVTGDSLGQVSSQTIHNLSIMDDVSKKPIFRPLIGLDKKNILQLANEIGTHPVSIRPHDDACSLFAVKHPILRPDKKYWNLLKENVYLKKGPKQCLENAEIYTISAKDGPDERTLSFGL